MFRENDTWFHSANRYETGIKYICSPVVRATTLTILLLLSLVITTAASAERSLLDEKRGVITVAPVIQKTSSAVVNISVATSVPGSDNPLYRDPFFRKFFGLPEEPRNRKALSAGSGVIVDAEKGYILTNHHVIDNAETITVKLNDSRSFKARLIGSDAATDIALIQVKADKLNALEFGASDKLQVGDFVVAIGNPFGLGQTVTSGIVSALGRSGISRDKFENFIQTDASINPGNSGGALINTKGELIGINTAIIAPGGGNVGIGFAVPSNMAKAVMNQLIRHGVVKRGRIGVSIQDLTPDLAKALDISVQHGALISQVENGSSADKAGMKPGDIILEIDGRSVKNSNSVRNIIGLKEIDSKANVLVYRKGKKITLEVSVSAPQTVQIDASEISRQLAGAKITELPDRHPAGDSIHGVLISEVAVNSPAWSIGLRAGDIITSINRRAVESIADFNEIMNAAGDVLAINIRRGDSEFYIVIR